MTKAQEKLHKEALADQKVADTKEIAVARETHADKLQTKPLKVDKDSVAHDKTTTAPGIHSGKLPKGTDHGTHRNFRAEEDAEHAKSLKKASK